MHPGIGGKRLAAPRGGRDAVRAVRRAGINPRILGRSCREPRRKQGFGMRQRSPGHESAKDEWASDKSAAVMRKQCHAISRRKMNPVNWAAYSSSYCRKKSCLARTAELVRMVQACTSQNLCGICGPIPSRPFRNKTPHRPGGGGGGGPWWPAPGPVWLDGSFC